MRAISLEPSSGRAIPHVRVPQTIVAWLTETVPTWLQRRRDARELESLPHGVLKDIGYPVSPAILSATEHGKIHNRGLRL